MTWLINGIRRLLNRPNIEPERIEDLRVEFRVRYHSFKQLLGANQKALEIMAEIEQALEGDRPFGMSFIRSCCTSLAVNVYSMIRNLARLAPGKHTGIEERYDHIVAHIIRIVTKERPISDRRLIIPLGSLHKDMTASVGSKMANLGEIIKNTDLKVPPGFVLTAYAYRRFLDHNGLQSEINRRIQTADLTDMERLYKLSAEIQQLIIRSRIPEDLSKAVAEAWERLEDEQGRPITAALRSSAIGEDSVGSSFAGQYRSELNVSRENVLHAIREILASKYSLQAMTYRLNKGFKDEDIAMCVGCMVMVDAVAGGVIYSCNPVDSGDRSISIHAALGLPKSVVDGSTACDLFIVSRNNPLEIVREEVREKTEKFACHPEEGVCRMDLTGREGSLPAIERRNIIQLAQQALVVENYFEKPQDIEWAMGADGTIFILQCRPLAQTERPFNGISDEKWLKYNDTEMLRGGVTASAGAACGPVYLVDKGFDMLGFPEGAVLLARQALPRWAPLIGRAAAVVTEQGGFAGHLANLAREFKVPALFGLEDAVEVLKPGELVTVSATTRTIHKGKVASLLAQKDYRKSQMAGSPVYQALVDTSRYIIPLNLLDPDSPDFKPQRCRTFHDIMRYIHEKSVQEMFTFGKEHNFVERSSKQLYHQVPMKWWILNLDNGFKEEIQSKYVKLSDIASIPMLAFWEGFTAIPWDGPPVDGKGLMSVMFQSTTNTTLIPCVRSTFADRNYVMISKNYCNLSSRLGYHFSMLEALVGDRERENYVSFKFQGGATDDQRRNKRVRFIGHILMEYGFRVKIKEDNLTAVVEGQAKDYMLDRIKVLGYLSLHTRQLDIIMSNAAKVNYYRNKINTNLKQIIGY